MVMDVPVHSGSWSTPGSLVSRQLSIKTESKRLDSQGSERPGTWRVFAGCTMKAGGGNGEKPRQFVFNILLVLDTREASEIGFRLMKTEGEPGWKPGRGSSHN